MTELASLILPQGMEELIKKSFPPVEVVGPHVMEGRYDLIGPDGEIILPSVWEKVVQPDWAITMRMWPGYEMSPFHAHWTHQPVKSPPTAPEKEDPEKIRLEAELDAIKAIEEKKKAAEKQKEVEAQIRTETEEETFRRRIKATSIDKEEPRPRIRRSRIPAEVRRRVLEEESIKFAKEARETYELAKLAMGDGKEKTEERVRAEKEARMNFEETMRIIKAERERLEERIKAEEAAFGRVEAGPEAKQRIDIEKREEEEEN